MCVCEESEARRRKIYSVMKNEIVLFIGKWMQLGIILIKISQIKNISSSLWVSEFNIKI